VHSGFFLLFAVGTHGRPMKTSFPYIVPVEDFILIEQPEESGYFWPNVGGPNFVPKRILDCVIPYNYIVSLMCSEGSSCLITPSNYILLIKIAYFLLEISTFKFF